MADAIAIATDLPFKVQAVEFVQHLSKAIPNHTDAAAKELLAQFDSQLQSNGSDVDEEKRRPIVKSLVEKTVELRGGFDNVREQDAEGAHLLLQNLLSSNFDVESEEYQEQVKKVVEVVKKAGEAAWSQKRVSRHETASRVLSNTYNFLPSSSPVRPTVLLSLIALLALSSDLKSLALTPAVIINSLSQWSISADEKLNFLTSASALYANARDSRKALELHIVVIEHLEAGPEAAERAVVYALADEKRFSLDDVLRVKGIKGKLSGKVAELVELFEGDAVEGVKKGQEWSSSNNSWIEGFSVPQFTADAIVRKFRFVALVAIASQSADQKLAYSAVASALAIDESEVELWVIDAIRENLLKARLSQPTSTVRILSVSSIAARQFGPSEWQLLEKRLSEWKKAVSDVRAVIDDAEALAAQGPATNRPARQDKGQRRDQRGDREGREGREGGRQEDEATA